MHPVRRMIVLSAVTAGLAVLTGCGSSAPAASTSTAAGPVTSTTAASPTTSATAAPTTTSAAAAPAPSTSVATPPNCPTGDLVVSLGGGEGAAGSTYYHLVFRNGGAAACELRGYPGVSLVGGDDGHQIGAAADEDASIPRVDIPLPPGAEAHVVLKVTQAMNYDNATCKPREARGLRVYPPGETASAFVEQSFHACAMDSPSLLSVTAMQSGA